MGRNGSRVDAMHAKSSITSTSTVRHGGLSTSTVGSPVGMPQAPGWLAQPEAKLRELTGICFPSAQDGKGRKVVLVEIRLANEPWAPVAQGHPGAEVV